MQKIINLFQSDLKINYKTEILSGLTVALALIPEAIAFALIAGLSPLTGLYAAFTIGLITSIFGGRPGMISGATGAVAVVYLGMIAALKQINQEIGVDEITQYVFATVVLAGIIQILCGVLKLGKFIRLVPQSVMYGFVNGLAIVIFMAQLDQFKLRNADGNLEWMQANQLYLMLALVALTMLIIWGLPKLTKAIPSSLTAIIVVSALVIGFSLDTKTVADTLQPGQSISGGFPPFHIPGINFTWANFMLILPYAFIVAAVGLIESLLTLNLIDQITQTKGKSNKEAVAQGAANVFTGFFSGMGGCAMIGQSLINISSGARARISGIVAAVMLLVFIMFGASMIEKLPMAALTGVMFMVAIGTFEWASFKTIGKMPWSDVLVIAVVTLVTVFLHNLALAVLVGVIISALVFAWENAKRIRARKFIDEKGVKHYEIYGPLFFGSITPFIEKFDIQNDPEQVNINFEQSRVADMSAIDALNNLTKLYKEQGKKITLSHLSPDCVKLIDKADNLAILNYPDDKDYLVMTEI